VETAPVAQRVVPLHHGEVAARSSWQPSSSVGLFGWAAADRTPGTVTDPEETA
jgi:hypothetical protein